MQNDITSAEISNKVILFGDVRLFSGGQTCTAVHRFRGGLRTSKKSLNWIHDPLRFGSLICYGAYEQISTYEHTQTPPKQI